MRVGARVSSIDCTKHNDDILGQTPQLRVFGCLTLCVYHYCVDETNSKTLTLTPIHTICAGRSAPDRRHWDEVVKKRTKVTCMTDNFARR